jgi:hypothetical protein
LRLLGNFERARESERRLVVGVVHRREGRTLLPVACFNQGL